MADINVLPFSVANLIAAGEVVDRPASVIKELMENAIDAGATRVTVEIQNGGTTFMRVSDNGCGMSPEDLPVSIRRHATSKIREADDLENILTLGFRGEALAAIASVSTLRIISKTADAEFGAVLEAHGGEHITVTEQGCSTGTSVIVENLFANVPARRKFLKKDVTETMAVTANVEKVALSNPNVAFRLVVDGNVRVETAGDGNVRSTAYALFGRDFANRLIEVEGENEGVEVHGFIGRTDNYKANRNFENFFVNGRFVKSKSAMAAIEQAYTSYMPPEKFPCCILYIDINPARVDVNVHPAKLEVKFSNEKAVFEAIYYTVRTALESNVTRPVMNLQSGFHRSGPRLSDATVPVDNQRPVSLQKRQLCYDLTGESQPQPQVRMTAEQYRNLMSGQAGRQGTQQNPTPQNQQFRSGASNPGIPDPAVPQTGVPSASGASEVQSGLTSQTAKAQTPPQELPVSGQPPKSSGSAGERAEPVPPVSSGAEQQNAEIPNGQPISDGRSDPPVPGGQNYQPVPDGQNYQPAPDNQSDPPAPDRQGYPPAPNGQNFDTVPYETAMGQNGVPFGYRIVGIVFNSYIIVELEDKMLLIDQHAAHERILFEQLKAGLKKTKAVGQMLMLPVETMMTSAEVEVLKSYDEELQKIGFMLRYARNTVFADAMPEGITVNAVSDMLGTIAGRLIDNTGSVKLTRDIIFEKALFSAACKAAIKGGREYAPEHIQWVVRKLMEIPDITFCPHGRPVALEITKNTLDTQFDRNGFK